MFHILKYCITNDNDNGCFSDQLEATAMRSSIRIMIETACPTLSASRCQPYSFLEVNHSKPPHTIRRAIAMKQMNWCFPLTSVTIL